MKYVRSGRNWKLFCRNFVAKKSQKSRKKVATLFYTFSEGGKKMSEKQEKKNAIADGEMAARGAATRPHGNAAATNKK